MPHSHLAFYAIPYVIYIKFFGEGIAGFMTRNVFLCVCLLGAELRESLTEIGLLTMGLKSHFLVGYQIGQHKSIPYEAKKQRPLKIWHKSRGDLKMCSGLRLYFPFVNNQCISWLCRSMQQLLYSIKEINSTATM